MSEITNAIKQICEEKGLSYEAVIATIESALAAAYRKDYGEKNQNIKVSYNPETNKSKVYDEKIVVEDLPEEELDEAGNVIVPVEVAGPELVEGEEKKRFNPKTDLQLKDALLIKPDAQIGDEIKTELETKDEYGRMAAQTAKQVIVQKLREAERDMVFNEYKDKEGEIVSGVIQRKEERLVLVDLGKATGILLPEDQIRSERYFPGQKFDFFIKTVRSGMRGSEIVLSRTAEDLLLKVFAMEIPEIANGLVEIKAVAREAGARSKVAVWAANDNIDPVGSCVGQRGSRIQTIINQLGGEKIDIIEYSEELEKFIANALSPAKISSVKIDYENHRADVVVADDQLSLAIGKDGQNVRLAARLTGYKIDILGAKKEETAIEEVKADEVLEEVEN